MLRHLTSFAIPSIVQSKLRENGFVFVEDLSDKDHNSEGGEILKRFGLNEKLATSIPSTISALDIWQEECCSPHIVTFCKTIDDMLHGGIAVREVTELCGAPGSGKTQLCLQLCVDVQIPESFGGLGGEALFIDTDSGFTPGRLKEMAEACVDHCQLVAFHQDQEDMGKEIASFTEDTIMHGVHYLATLDYVQLIAAVHSIKNVLEENKQVKLVVIDSIAFPFRNGTLESLQRTRLLCSILDELKLVAVKFSVAVVITNQLTTRITAKNESQLVPALGDSFGQYSNQRLMLGHLHQNCFAAACFKSATCPQMSAKFQISKSGIRDCIVVK